VIFVNPLQIKFLNEPFWRWVLFLIAIGLALAVWRGVLGEMA